MSSSRDLPPLGDSSLGTFLAVVRPRAADLSRDGAPHNGLDVRVRALDVLATSSAPGLDGAPFKTLEGAALSTTDWKGKVVVLNYWATWCVPCRSEIPEFNRIQDELGAKGVEVVGISMDEDGAEVVKPFLQKNPMKYTVGLGSGSMEQLPVTVVLDRNGNTVKRFDQLATPAEIRAAITKAQAAG